MITNKLMKFWCVCSLLLQISLHALPPVELYCERVAEGLRWHREHNLFGHLTDERIDQIQPLMKAITEKEVELHEKYYQFVTGLDSKFLAYQIILKEFYKIKYNESFNDFEFMRSYKDPNLANDLWMFLGEHPDLITLEELAKNPATPEGDEAPAIMLEGYENDTVPEIRQQLISASLTMETKTTLDSAQFVFAQGAGMSKQGDEELLKYIVEAFSLEHVNTEQLENRLKTLIEKAPRSREGMILQIFVPKDEAENIFYVAYGGGILKQDETANKEVYFIEHEMKRDNLDFESEKNDQVRLLAGNLTPLNVKIFRYTTISQQEIEAYEELVRTELSALF